MPHVGRAGWSLKNIHCQKSVGGNDPALAEQLLIEHAALIGQLHGATIGRFEEYRRLRSALGPEPIPQKIYQDPWSDARLRPITRSEIDDAISTYHESFAAVGIRPQPGVNEEIELVTAAVEENPGLLLAYCKGDQNGAGDYIRQGGNQRLFDFGSGGFRHAFIEGMPWRLPDAIKSDRQRGPTTLRQQVIAWIEAFAELSEEHGQMQALGRSARAMWKRLQDLWPAESRNLPYYPAFRDSAGKTDFRTT